MVLYVYVQMNRFIPTCMGNAWDFYSAYSQKSVHPHVHGERIAMRVVGYVIIGSSPRAWGTPFSLPSLPGNTRFIPTCMGNASDRFA